MRIPENYQYVLFGGTFILANKLQYVADRMVAGIPTKQWFLLRTLQDMPTQPPSTITTLANETNTTRQNNTKMLELLHRKGYVTLTDNPNDQRSRLVEMTEQGRQMLDVMASRSMDFFLELFDGISEEECETAARVTIKLIENLGKMQDSSDDVHANNKERMSL